MKIITKNTPKEKVSEKINPLQRHNFLSKDDLKTIGTYGLVAVVVSFTAWGLLTSYYKQITK